MSIVITVRDGAAVTRQCLYSVLHSTEKISYEVIVVDDASGSEVEDLLASVDGLVLLRNPEPWGFVKSSNRGASAARGKFLVLLHNDTEPQPGWLSDLISCAERCDRAGAVAAKLLHMDAPDHTLQEAGGIVWQDATASRFGDGDRRWLAEYSFNREVDYGSAAALLVRTEAWDEVGGFDERFSPALWESIDLCFSLRSAGWKVVFEPLALVLHHGGASIASGAAEDVKSSQVIDRKKFAEKWGADLTAHPAEPGPERALLASNWRRSPTVFIIDHDLPMPDRDSASIRMMHIIETFTDKGWRVIFVPENRSDEAPYLQNLRQMGVEVLREEYNLAEHLTALAPDLELVILSRPYIAARYLHEVRSAAPDAVVAYDTVDLHYLREGRRAKVASDETEDRLRRLAEGHRQIEEAVCRSSDITLAVSVEEAEVVREFSGKPVHVVGNANPMWDEVPGPEARSGVIFIGNFAHEPNVDAARFLLDEVMPIIWKDLPGTRATIVGPEPPAGLERRVPGPVTATGWVPEVAPFLQGARVSLAPLRFGAGVKGKVTESLAAGLPVVTTSMGAEGLSDGGRLCVADDAAGLAAHAVKLLTDDDIWRRQSALGQEIASEASSQERQASQIEELIALLPDLRKRA